MRIVVLFQFNHEEQPAAVSGVAGDVTDMILPAVGDAVEHSDAGEPFQGKVTSRMFKYELPVGNEIDGRVTVTLCLDRMTVQ